MPTEQIISIVIIAIMALAFIGYIAYKIKTKGLRAAAIEFIVAAEKQFAQGQNSQKMDYVCNAVILLLPKPFQVFVTKQTIISFVQKIFDEVKVALDYQNELPVCAKEGENK